ncbi:MULTISPECIES: hypothetical protein [unclassified Cupriavidus]|uniref:hypothetical protein n=1 Tax=unclassified Cupriavidus TaxID=2640874 RepID=UPI00088BAA76|nr:hypothetical protein [Cupriavidus sp. YR651]SDC27315.1 hypothetical protein SAMN05216345_1011180 [Cupriavidus sp. YR651]
MAMINLFATEFRQLRADAAHDSRDREAGRLRRKLVRKEIGMAIVTLGAMAMFLDAARGLSFLAT